MEGDAPSSSRALARRASFRPEIRGALALEEAGELNEAARVFEYAGEHGQAAALRLEYADTLGDDALRLRVLREGAARNPGDNAEGRALHLALADALLRSADALDHGARQRSLRLEAARSLDEADEGERSGAIYEGLGLLTRAAAAYERAGALTQLEVVLELLEHRERAETALVKLEREVEAAWTSGRRRDAHLMLLEHVREHEHVGRLPRPSLVRMLERLESSRPNAGRVDLRWGSGEVTRVRTGSSFVIGRDPDVDLTIFGPELSRSQVELSMQSADDGAALAARDLGSPAGSFWGEEPLAPGTPLIVDAPGRLGLGFSVAIDVTPVHAKDTASPCGALLRPQGADGWWLFLPGGGPIALSPDARIGAAIAPEGTFLVMVMDATVTATLGREALGPGARLELLVGDRLELRDGQGVATLVEVLA